MDALVKQLLAEPTAKYDAEVDETGGSFAKQTIKVILIKSNQRLEFKNAVRQTLQINGNYTERKSTFKAGSVDPVEFVLNNATTNSYRLIFKPKSAGGSGAGSEVTDLGEAMQCYILAARQEKSKDINFVSDVVKFENKVKLNTNCPKVPFKKAVKDTASDWIASGEAIGNQIYDDKFLSSTKKYEFHHQSKLVNQIYDCFKVAIKTTEPGLRMQNDKWNPADIWAFEKNKINELTVKYRPQTYGPLGVGKLNADLLKDFNDKVAMGISLKKFETGSPHGTILNFGEKFVAGDFEFTGFRNHTADKFNTQDVFMEFTRKNDKGKVKGEIQFRAFGSGHQGNITKIGGSTASAVHGKVGVYETFFMNALKRESVFDSDFIPKVHEKNLNKAAQNKDFKFGDNNYYTIAEYISKYTGVSRDKAYNMIDKYNGPAFHSSFLGIQLVHYFNKLSSKGQKDLLTKLATYGMSQVPGISCVHAKYE